MFLARKTNSINYDQLTTEILYIFVRVVSFPLLYRFLFFEILTSESLTKSGINSLKKKDFVLLKSI